MIPERIKKCSSVSCRELCVVLFMFASYCGFRKFEKREIILSIGRRKNQVGRIFDFITNIKLPCRRIKCSSIGIIYVCVCVTRNQNVAFARVSIQFECCFLPYLSVGRCILSESSKNENMFSYKRYYRYARFYIILIAHH